MEHDKVKIQGLDSRYLPPEGINTLMESFSTEFDISTIGHSVEGRPIQKIKIGKGSTIIFMWSQMHGNETTTTRALFDLINMFLLPKRKEQDWLERITIHAIPMLNPDGAARYTRQNAKGVDLNRDAQLQSQPETKALFSAFEKIKPDFCLNLHDQRTRYAVGNSEVPSTLAFLSPSADEPKTITAARKGAMQLIAGIYDKIQTESNIGISRYDDAYNTQCVGDTFTSMGTPTLLFEAGHYPGDYNRHITRKYIYESLYIVLDLIAHSLWDNIDHQRYFEIPENKTSFADIVLKNGHSQRQNSALPLNFEEQLVNGEILFIPKPISEEYATSYLGHKTFDLKNKKDV
ncbi:MAG: peptidase M14, partial [Bacteroidia bacterium]|nr:peptidase M14 [Bacteroidia bacterium]